MSFTGKQITEYCAGAFAGLLIWLAGAVWIENKAHGESIIELQTREKIATELLREVRDDVKEILKRLGPQ